MTVGERSDQLAKEIGNSTLGIYILELALRKACGVPNTYPMTINGKLLHQTPGYQECLAKEEEDLEFLKDRYGE